MSGLTLAHALQAATQSRHVRPVDALLEPVVVECDCVRQVVSQQQCLLAAKVHLPNVVPVREDECRWDGAVELAAPSVVSSDVTGSAGTRVTSLTVVTEMTARKLLPTFVHVLARLSVRSQSIAIAAAALIADRPILAKLSARHSGIAFVDVASLLVREIAAVILAVARQVLVDAGAVRTLVSIGAALGRVILQAQRLVFVRIVAALVDVIAQPRGRNACHLVLALELVAGTRLIDTGQRLVGLVAAVVVPIAIETLVDASIILTLKRVFGTSLSETTLFRMFVGRLVVRTIVLAVAHPRHRNALTRLVTSKLVLGALTRLTVFRLVRSIRTIRKTVALPRLRYTSQVGALKFIRGTRIVTVLLVRTGRGVRGVSAVLISIADPRQRNAASGVTPVRVVRTGSGETGGTGRRRFAVLLVRIIPAVVLTVADPVRMDASRRPRAIDERHLVEERRAVDDARHAITRRTTHLVAGVAAVRV